MQLTYPMFVNIYANWNYWFADSVSLLKPHCVHILSRCYVTVFACIALRLSLSLSSPLPLSHCSGKNSITAAKQPAKVGIPSSTVIDWGNESFFVARVRLFRRPTCTVIHQLAILYRVVTEIHPLFLKNHLFVNSELDLINYVWFSSIFLAAERFFSRGIPESYYGKTDLNNFCWRSKINLHH